ncbi:hypothetical protein Q0Q56_14310, partial [Staphylococcus aureus]|nr:hypothetical protein [Staphylococcus aureus]
QDPELSLSAIIEAVVKLSLYPTQEDLRNLLAVASNPAKASSVLSFEAGFSCGHTTESRSGLAEYPSGKVVLGEKPQSSGCTQ